VEGATIGIRIDGYCFNAKLGTGANDADGDLAAISHQQSPKWWGAIWCHA
jgi:hypothetical protein